MFAVVGSSRSPRRAAPEGHNNRNNRQSLSLALKVGAAIEFVIGGGFYPKLTYPKLTSRTSWVPGL